MFGHFSALRTCVGQVDDGHEHHAGRQGHAQEEEGLELLLGQPVLQVLQEGVGLQQHEDPWRSGADRLNVLMLC